MIIMELRHRIKKVLNEHMEFSIKFRRRIEKFKNFIWNCFVTTYPCDFEDFTTFMLGIHNEISDIISEGYDDKGKVSDWLTYEEGVKYVEKYMMDDLKTFYYDNCKNRFIESQITENLDNLKEKILKQINKFGLYDFLRLSSMTYTELRSIVGDDSLTRKIQQNFIQSFINEIGGISLSEIKDGDVIQYKTTDKEYMELTFLGVINVIIDVFDNKNFNFNGEFKVSYHNLNDEIIEEIFDKLTSLYDEYYFNEKK